MNAPGLMSAALELMLLGMGTVFVFLVLLVCLTNLMSRVLARLAPPGVVLAPANQAAEVRSDATLHAVIVAAIHAHRSRQP